MNQERASGQRRALCALLSCVLLATGLACGDDDAGEPLDGKAGSTGHGGSERDASDQPRSDAGRVQPGSDSGTTPSPLADAATGPAQGGSGGSGGAVSGECSGLLPNTLPDELACTGLYDDIDSKTIATGVREFAPAFALWSDGAEKTRWVYLPEGTTIDASDPNDWRFPIGTKLWKEFRWNGRRAETRLFWKVGDGRWIKAPYRWNDDESGATRFAGGMVQVGGDDYYIPSAKECDQCHKGRIDRALGFEPGLLGLDGATGLTLAKLIDEGLLTNNGVPASLQLGDDGTGVGAQALGWLHVNCGVSCHNANSASEGFKTDLRFRLSAAELDGSSLALTDARTTSINADAKTPRWLGKKIITPGSPADSLLYSLITHRDPTRMQDQMPPIASRKVDADGTAAIEAWINALGESPP